MNTLSALSIIYIDPAMTSYIIQIIAGVVVACGAAVGIFWNKISRFFRNKKNAKNGAAEQAPKASAKPEGKGEKSVITADDLLSDDDKDE